MKLSTSNLELVKRAHEWLVEGKVVIIVDDADFQLEQKDFRISIDTILNGCVPKGVVAPNWSFGLPSVNRWEYWIRSFKEPK